MLPLCSNFLCYMNRDGRIASAFASLLVKAS